MTPSSPQDVGTQQRVLLVFETLLHHGQLSIEALTGHLPISQSAVYRAVRQLCDAGWVDQNISRTAFVATPRMNGLLSQKRVGLPATDAFRDVIKDKHLRQNYFMDFMVLDNHGQVVIVDSTDRTQNLYQAVSALSNLAGRAAICTLHRKDRVRFLSHYLENALEEEKTLATAEGFAANFKYPDNQNYLKGEDSSVAFGFMYKDQVGAICVRLKNPLEPIKNAGLKHLEAFFQASDLLSKAGVNVFLKKNDVAQYD